MKPLSVLARLAWPLLPIVDRVSQTKYVHSMMWALQFRNVSFSGEPKWLSTKAFYDSAPGEGIEIGQGVVVSHYVKLLTHDFSLDRVVASLEERSSEYEMVRYAGIKLGDFAFIGIGATILPGCHVGRGSIVAAGAVVTRTVEENVVVAGNPARVISTSTEFLDRSRDKFISQRPRR